MAHRLETYLWRKSGNDPAAYADKDTLKVRLKHLAMAMGKTGRPQGQQGQQPGVVPQQQPPQQGTPQQRVSGHDNDDYQGQDVDRGGFENDVD